MSLYQNGRKFSKSEFLSNAIKRLERKNITVTDEIIMHLGNFYNGKYKQFTVSINRQGGPGESTCEVIPINSKSGTAATLPKGDVDEFTYNSNPPIDFSESISTNYMSGFNPAEHMNNPLTVLPDPSRLPNILSALSAQLAFLSGLTGSAESNDLDNNGDPDLAEPIMSDSTPSDTPAPDIDSVSANDSEDSDESTAPKSLSQLQSELADALKYYNGLISYVSNYPQDLIDSYVAAAMEKVLYLENEVKREQEKQIIKNTVGDIPTGKLVQDSIDTRYETMNNSIYQINNNYNNLIIRYDPNAKIDGNTITFTNNSDRKPMTTKEKEMWEDIQDGKVSHLTMGRFFSETLPKVYYDFNHTLIKMFKQTFPDENITNANIQEYANDPFKAAKAAATAYTQNVSLPLTAKQILKSKSEIQSSKDPLLGKGYSNSLASWPYYLDKDGNKVSKHTGTDMSGCEDALIVSHFYGTIKQEDMSLPSTKEERTRYGFAPDFRSKEAGKNYGNRVCIEMDDGKKIILAHMKSVDPYIVSELEKGNSVKVVPGTPLGIVGSTGNSTGPHLHISVLSDGSYINPYPYLNERYQ